MSLLSPAGRFGLALLLLAPAGLAQIWTEVNEAGNLPATAQVVRGYGPLTQIQGNINDPTDVVSVGHDVDMYLIQIDNPATFQATTVNGSTLDTQLFLFHPSGLGVAADDDDPLGFGGVRSRLSGTFVPGPGRYLLAVSQYDVDPTAAGLELWNDTPFAVERQPDGPGAASAVTGWDGGSSNTGSYTIFLTGASFVCDAFLDDFEAVAASPSGTILSGQAGYYIPPAATSVDFLWYMYAGNTLGIPANPTGGAQFIGGVGPAGGAFARAQKDFTYPTSGNLSVGFDLCAGFNGTLPTAQNLGSISLQPGTSRNLIALLTWVDINTATNFNINFNWFDAAGTSVANELVPTPSFQNLPINHWFHLEFDISFSTNQALQVRLTDISTGSTAIYNPAGRYLLGGVNGGAAPTAFRFFAGGGLPGNIVAYDNMCIQPVAHQPGFFTPPQLVDLGSVPGTNDFSPTLTPDELHMIFASDRAGSIGGYDLFETWRTSVNGAWAVPVPVAWANSVNNDYECNLVEAPWIGPGVFELHWLMAGATSDIWEAALSWPTLGAPSVPVMLPVIAPGNANQPGYFNDDVHVTEDGTTMFFTSSGNGTAAGGADIYTATRIPPVAGAPWTLVGPFAPANSAAFDHSPTPEANGHIVWFASLRGGGPGSSDLWMTYLDDNTGLWSAPILVNSLNSVEWESNTFRANRTGRMYISTFPATGARIWMSNYEATNLSLWAPSNPASSMVAVDRVFADAVPQPWNLDQLFVRNWILPVGSNLTAENYDPNIAGGANFLLLSAVPVGSSQSLVPGFEIGNFMLDQSFVFTYLVTVADSEGSASTPFNIPPNPLLSGLPFTMQTAMLDFSAPSGHVVVHWSEPSRCLIQ